MNLSRRKLLYLAGVFGVSSVLSNQFVNVFKANNNKFMQVAEASENSEPKPRYGMFIDLDKCIGCNACTRACISENNLPEKITPNRVIDVEYGRAPNLDSYYQPVLCMHCEKPVCAQVCPVRATYKRADGIVVQDNNKCIGCKYCILVCPYKVRTFNKKPPFSYNKEHPGGNHPGGVVIKCTFCMHRVDAGNLVTACNEVCPTDARYFGDLNDRFSETSRLILNRKAIRLKEEKLTDPQIYYGMVK